MTHILMGAGVAAAYCLLVLILPQHPCFACWGRRVRPRGARRVPCRSCHATGTERWPAAGLVHRFFWSVLGDRLLHRHDKEK